MPSVALSATDETGPSQQPDAPDSDSENHKETEDGVFPVFLPLVQQQDGRADQTVSDQAVSIQAASVTSTTLYVSVYNNPDIRAIDIATQSDSLYFDGSDVGLATANLNAFHLEDDGSLLLSVDRTVTLPGLSESVTENDIVRFVPTSLGDTTAGSYTLYFDGSDVGLETSGEDIDALSRAPDGRLVMSLLNTYSIPGANSTTVTGNDEDLVLFTDSALGETTAGTWEKYLDGADAGLNNASSEDVHGVWVDPTSVQIYLTTYGSFTTADSVSGDDDDIFVCDPVTLGETTDCTFSNYWDGDIDGFANWRLDALHIVGVSGGSSSIPVLDPIDDSDNDGSYTLSWSTVTDAVAYQVEGAPAGAAGYWQTLYSGPSSSHATAAPTVSEWCYRVRANFSNQAGTWSEPACITPTVAGPPLTIGQPVTTTTLYYSQSSLSDILAFDEASGTTTTYFDGSDVDLIVPAVDAFHLEADGSILLSLDRTIAVPGIAGDVGEADIVRFVPALLGETTIGSFELLLDGSDVGLSDLIGVTRAPNGQLVVSTANGQALQILAATSLGENSVGTLSTYFEAEDLDLDDSYEERIHGLWLDGAAGELYLTVNLSYTVSTAQGPLSGDSNDILRCAFGAYMDPSSCTYSTYWDGGANGIGGVGTVDGLHIHRPTAASGTLSGQVFLDNNYDGQRNNSDRGGGYPTYHARYPRQRHYRRHWHLHLPRRPWALSDPGGRAAWLRLLATGYGG